MIIMYQKKYSTYHTVYLKSMTSFVPYLNTILPVMATSQRRIANECFIIFLFGGWVAVRCL